MPRALNTNLYPGVVNVIDLYADMWFDNRNHRHANMANLIAAHAAESETTLGWHWRSQCFVFLDHPENETTLGRENTVVHEMGHRMGLVPPSPPDAIIPNDIGPNYAHIDAYFPQVPNWCNTESCIMNYTNQLRTVQGKFCTYCLVIGSGGTNYLGEARMDSLRTGYDW